MTTLHLDLSEPALAEISAAGEGVRAYRGDDAASEFTERVASVFAEATERLAEEVAVNNTGKSFDRPDESASIRWAQPVYRLRVETATKRKRASSAGLWFAYYSLRDRAGTGQPDTMFVHAFVHSAAEPLGINGE